MSDEEIEESSRRIDEILAKKDRLSVPTEVSLDEPRVADFDWEKNSEAQAAAEAQVNAILAERTGLSEKELAAQEKAIEKAKKQQAAEEEMLQKQQLQEAEEQRLQGIRESAIISDQRIVDLTQEQNALQTRLNDLKKAGLGYGTEEYDSIAARLKEINAEVRQYQSELGNVGKLSDKELAAQEKAVEKVKKQQAAEEEMLRKKQLQEAEEQRLQGIRESAIISDQHMVDLLQEQNALQTRLHDLKKAGLGYGTEEYDSVAARLKEINAEVKQYQSGLGNAGKAAKEIRLPVNVGSIRAAAKNTDDLTGGFKKASDSAKKCFNTIDKHSKKSSGMLGKMSGKLKGLMLTMLIFSQIRKAFTAMVSAMSEGFKNLAQYSADYNGAMSAMKSETATLKNNLAAAFEPIVTAVIPYITQLIGWLNKAVDTIGQFFAAISGKSTYTRAKKQVIDYAKSVEKAAQAAKGALASFDEINVLQDNSSDSSGGEATGADAFETAEIGSGIQEMIDSLQPFRDIFDEWLAGLDFAPLLASLGELKTACEPFAGYLYDGLKWFLSDVLGPIGTWTINKALPQFIDMLAEGISFLDTAIQTIKPTLDYIWNNLLVPIGNFTGEVFLWAIGLMKEAFSDLATLFKEKGDKINNILTAIARCFELLWLCSKIGIQFIMGCVSTLVKYLVKIAGDIIDILDGIIEFIAGVFTGDWERAWNGLVGVFKGIINLCIDIFEGLVNGIIDGLNFISVDVPDWVPGIGGMHFGFDLERLSLPRLATGGIVTSSTLANIGEAGREAVLPLDNNTEWMDMLADRIGDRNVVIRFEGSLSELGRVLKPVIAAEDSRIGKNFRTK